MPCQVLQAVTSNPGVYILLVFLPGQQSVRVGSLGVIDFLPGWYAYMGSACGLRARVCRHLRQDKKLHWHIDYFLAVGILKEVVTIESKVRKE